ncbi:hypothetical protein L1987_63214 [Smallanthus sonchifolius]|uniref:Uncharacterized protein n=1 Tax=Smallanthus sonchifolius TaxID=185202 RepID=A0ACB9CCW4_9ASTR|nr:hypothetical protein L1987_63214 [Smallanthus sonchifolius]
MGDINVHEGHDSTRIKLFGKMINVQVMSGLKEPENKSEIDDDDDDQTLANKRPEKIMPCPRCKSMETKFCYFNNYNVNQPRHFCKGCQRYWTAGGALRNVPVGAGRRKAKPPFGHGLLVSGFSEDLTTSSGSGVHFDGVVEWQMAAHGCYQHLFPVKRRRNSNSTGDF